MAKIHSFITTLLRQDDKIIVDDVKITHQAYNVLKLKKGEFIYLGDGQNIRYKTQIIDINKKQIMAKIIDQENSNETQLQVIIALATIKREAFEYALEKLAEVGVYGIMPIASDKVIKKGINIDRSKNILREASEQAMRITVPKLYEEMDMQSALKYFINNGNTQILFCDAPQTEPQTSGSKVTAKPYIVKDFKSIVIFIGPEGGWSEREMVSIDLLGIPKYSLGQNVLRAETAAIVAGYMAVNNKL